MNSLLSVYDVFNQYLYCFMTVVVTHTVNSCFVTVTLHGVMHIVVVTVFTMVNCTMISCFDLVACVWSAVLQGLPHTVSADG